MSKSDAERKALQRQGWRARTVWLPTALIVPALLAEGLITDAAAGGYADPGGGAFQNFAL
jgi:hypothetical protein